MELCTDKTKVLIFNSNGKGDKEKWKWKNREIEEVKSFKYLNFTFNRKGNCKDHIRELYRKGRIAANRV